MTSHDLDLNSINTDLQVKTSHTLIINAAIRDIKQNVQVDQHLRGLMYRLYITRLYFAIIFYLLKTFISLIQVIYYLELRYLKLRYSTLIYIETP